MLSARNYVGLCDLLLLHCFFHLLVQDNWCIDLFKEIVLT